MNFETFRQISDVFARAFDPATTLSPFDKDLDNPVYQKIVQNIREFKPEAHDEMANKVWKKCFHF